MKFPYRRYDVQEASEQSGITTVYRPVVPVHVIGASNGARILGLLDTGADATLLPAFLINALGVDVDLKKTARFRGVGNQVVSVTQGQVEFQIDSGRRAFRGTATVGFIEGRSVAILGHQEFLSISKPRLIARNTPLPCDRILLCPHLKSNPARDRGL